MKIKVCYLASLLLLLLACTENRPLGKEDNTNVYFGKLSDVKISDCIQITHFLPLETTDASLVGAIDQLEVVGDRIVLSDSHTTNSIFVFSAQNGKFLSRLSGGGNGPGEFLSPHSFWVEYSDSSLYVLDRMLSKLIKYRLSDFSYMEEIKIPAISPLAFAVLPDSRQFLYYYPLRSKDLFSGNQVVKADKQGNVLSTCYQAPPSGKILHGNPAAFYKCEHDLCLTPYFSNNIYEWKEDSLLVRYHLGWGNSRFPEEEVFKKEDSSEIMKKILSENYIRFLFVYENTSYLAAKYYIKKELYLSAWNKKNNHLFYNLADKVIDDLGIGDSFPLPVGISGTDELVGTLQPQGMNQSMIKNKDLLSIFSSMDEEDNPILVFYTLK